MLVTILSRQVCLLIKLNNCNFRERSLWYSLNLRQAIHSSWECRGWEVFISLFVYLKVSLLMRTQKLKKEGT